MVGLCYTVLTFSAGYVYARTGEEERVLERIVRKHEREEKIRQERDAYHAKWISMTERGREKECFKAL